LEQFLLRVEAFRKGHLRELEQLLQEAQTLQSQALTSTTPTSEREAIRGVEEKYERAGRVATVACRALQDLDLEAAVADAASGANADVKRQSIAGVTTLLQQALRALFQAQHAFRAEMEAKSQRQLRIAFPDASEKAMADLSARWRSSATTIQEIANHQPGGQPLNPTTVLMNDEQDMNKLERLAASARVLKQAFTEVDLLVSTQGERINDIALHVAAARNSTEAAQEQLLEATRLRDQSRRRMVLMCTFALMIILVGLLVLVLLKKISFG
jgi:t-SNARE complex subunit (syntaxin)